MLQAIDSAYWNGGTGRGRHGKCGMMIEEICMLIERVGAVVLMYMPAHVGSTMSAVADAVAKRHTSGRGRWKTCVWERGFREVESDGK